MRLGTIENNRESQGVCLVIWLVVYGDSEMIIKLLEQA